MNICKYIKGIISCFLFFCVIFFNCSKESKEFEPQVKEGIIDLKNWDFQKGPVNLKGDWEFYWNKFLDPETYLKARFQWKKHYIAVPKTWSPLINPPADPALRNIGPTGYATYVLKIKGLDPKLQYDLAIQIENARCAYSLYFLPLDNMDRGFNNEVLKPLMKNGVVGKTEKEETPEAFRQLKKIPSYGETNIILVNVSNHVSFSGGLTKKIILGLETDLLLRAKMHGYISFLVLGILLIMIFYHLLLFFLVKFEKANLYFSLMCISIGIWFLLYDHLMQDFILHPSVFDFMFMEVLTLFSYHIAVPLCVSFLWELFPFNKGIKRLVYTVWGITLVTFFVRFIDYKGSFLLFFGFNFFIILCIVFGYVFLVIVIRQGREGAFLSLLGFLIFTLAAANDVLRTHNILQTPVLSPMGLLFFVITHSVILSKKFLRFSKVRTGQGETVIRKEYNRSNISDINVEKTRGMLLRKMEEDKLYRNEKLTIRSLARSLSMTLHQLSEFINIEMRTNFKNFVNTYRVDEAKVLLLENRERSIISIAYDVGFNSSTNFHRTFKKLTGFTPREYREKN